MTTYRLRLYVSGRTAHSLRAIANLNSICDGDLRGRCEVDIVDVTDDPRSAEADGIFATPMLLRVSPLPARRIVGDLGDRTRVLSCLGVSSDDLHHVDGLGPSTT